jgi:hypothetical protein
VIASLGIDGNNNTIFCLPARAKDEDANAIFVFPQEINILRNCLNFIF